MVEILKDGNAGNTNSSGNSGSQPLVAVALAGYDVELDIFAVQLQSIVEQTYTNWVCVITFDSPIEKYRELTYFSDPRFQWVENPVRLGSKKNFEKALQLCLRFTPDLICFSDQDDLWYPHKIEKSVKEHLKRPPLSASHCDMHLLKLSESKSAYQLAERTAWDIERRGVENATPADMLIRNMAAGAGMIMDAELGRRFPCIPDEFSDHDHWYAVVASYSGGLYPIHDALYQYRIHLHNIYGVTEYRGFLSKSVSSEKLGIVNKLKSVARLSRGYATAAVASGLPVGCFERVLAIRPWDLGLSYLILALRHCFGDRALSRAALARCLGKILLTVD